MGVVTTRIVYETTIDLTGGPMTTASDDAALKLAMEQAMMEPGRREQIKSKLLDEPWVEVAKFAAYSRQWANLKLELWEVPPCEIGDPDATPPGHRGEREAAQL